MVSVGRVFVLGAVLVGLAGSASATVYEVNAAATCPGSGTTATPFCTIGGAAAIAVAGDTVNVASGIYREEVTPASSGASGVPVTYHGAVGARVYGTLNLSGAGLWTLSSGTTYVTPYDPPTNPSQVFVDGVRLITAADAASVPSSGFFYDSAGKQLYVNLGGGNPGSHAVEAGARSFGFNVANKSDIVVDGFEVRGQNTNGIRVRSSSNVVVSNNRVLQVASFGLVADGTLSPATTTGPVEISGNEVAENANVGIRLRNNVILATVRGNSVHHNQSHGLYASDTTLSVFENNVFYANATPVDAFTTGMRLDGSDDNVIRRNLAYDNQDSGFQVGAGSDRNVLARNISYANQDHGFDVRECDGARVVSNTSYGNLNDGISVEGNVTNATLRNNVSVENGLLTNGNDLYVRNDSTVGFSSDYDVFWHSSGNRSVNFDGTIHATLADYATATGQEAHGIGADPGLADPVAFDFHPGLGPTTDAADASATGFELLDYDGAAPIDVTTVPDAGAGVPTYADIGALERVDAPPSASLQVSPKKASIGQTVTADASGSTDDGGIVSYRFEWGDGTVVTQAGPVATHAYQAKSKGTYKVRVTVTDGAGQTATKQQPVQVK